MELRDEFIQEFVTRDLDYFNSKYKEGRRGRATIEIGSAQSKPKL